MTNPTVTFTEHEVRLLREAVEGFDFEAAGHPETRRKNLLYLLASGPTDGPAPEQMQTKPASGSELAAREIDRVAKLVRGRESHHGDAVNQHAEMARLFAGYLKGALGLDVTLNASDAAMMCLLLKISRIMEAGPKPEHVEDIIGYAGIVLACKKSVNHA